MDVTFFQSRADFRAWLEQHHDSAKELQIGFYKVKSGQTGMTYEEAIEEALCFGWIDGKGKRIDDHSYTVRFTPRKPRSIWSAINIERVERLKAEGRMHPAGLRAYEARDASKTNLYSYENKDRELDERYAEQLRSHPEAWAFFQAQAPSYQRSVKHWIMSAKAETTRQRRLEKLIEESARGERLAQFVSPGRRKSS
ncbi:MAG: YdeI/OmpD-associated family protein [Chloroflexota bacterium]|nr:MAG: bacteriocin-protection protein [Chloroflexota bacterium]